MFTLFIGGSGSGKSSLAEAFAVSRPAALRYYIATMDVYDDESRRRVQRHRRMRAGKGFTTIECPVHLEDVSLPEPGTVLLECLSNLLANELYSPNGRGRDCVEAILKGIDLVRNQTSDLIIVSNNVFEEGVIYPEETEGYRRMLGELHQRLTVQADQVIEAVLGIPVVLKGQDDLVGTKEYGEVSSIRPCDFMNTKGSGSSEIKRDPEKWRSESEKDGMILITGGRYQGKLAWAQEYLLRREGTAVSADAIWDGGNGFPPSWDGIRIFTGLPRLVQKILREESDSWDPRDLSADPLQTLADILDRPGLIVITEEMGNGIVPMDAADRHLREEVGRLGCRLAVRAEGVYRVLCGIPQRIKP